MLEHVRRGLSSPEIAAQLERSVSTVRSHAPGIAETARQGLAEGSSGRPPDTSWASINAFSLTAEVGGQRLYRTLSAIVGPAAYGGSTRLLFGSTDSAGFYSGEPADSRPELMIRVIDADGLRHAALHRG